MLKILTYNIHHANPPEHPGRIDLAAIAGVIRDSGAGLVALQEVDIGTERSGKAVDQAAELGRLTGMAHHFVKTIDHDGGDYGIAILSKYPFLKTGGDALPLAYGGEERGFACVAVEPQPGRTIVFASTHLDLLEENQLVQAKQLCEWLGAVPHPVILGGDFNAVPGSPTINLLDAHFTRARPQNARETSAAIFHPQGDAREAPAAAPRRHNGIRPVHTSAPPKTFPAQMPEREIDYIFYRPSHTLRLEEYEIIPERYASDHLPVYSRFAFCGESVK